MAWEVHHGSITKAIFLDFMRTRVLPQCTPGGSGPRSVVVMDNARWTFCSAVGSVRWGARSPSIAVASYSKLLSVSSLQRHL